MKTTLVTELELAGFSIHQTGGGCTAWRNESGPDGAHILITDAQGCSHDIAMGQEALIGLYNAEGDSVLCISGRVTA